MQHPVDVAAIGAAAMDEIAFEDVAVGFEPVDGLLDHCLSVIGVVEAGAAVAGLDAEGQVADHHGAVVVQVLVERFDGGGRSAAVVLGQRHKHPAHRGCLLPGAVEDVLAGVDNLLGAGE